MEERHRARCVGWSTDLPCPLQAHHLPSTSVCSATWKFTKSHCSGVSITQSPVSLSSLEAGRAEAESFHPLIMFGLFFFFLIFTFIFGCLGSSLQHAGSSAVVRGLLIAGRGRLSSCGVRAPEHAGSIVVAHMLICCGARA